MSGCSFTQPFYPKKPLNFNELLPVVDQNGKNTVALPSAGTKRHLVYLQEVLKDKNETKREKVIRLVTDYVEAVKHKCLGYI